MFFFRPDVELYILALLRIFFLVDQGLNRKGWYVDGFYRIPNEAKETRLRKGKSSTSLHLVSHPDKSDERRFFR